MMASIFLSAKALGLPLRARGIGYDQRKTAEELRADCLDYLYGKNQGQVIAKTRAELDKRIAAGVLGRQGKLGRHIQRAQQGLRTGQNALSEYRRITGLKRRRPADEARLLREAKTALAECEAAQARHCARASQ